MFFFFQAEDGIRALVRSRGLGDVYKRQVQEGLLLAVEVRVLSAAARPGTWSGGERPAARTHDAVATG